MKKTAIVADDHEVFRVFLSAILRDNLGFDAIVTADSFESVVAAVDKAPRASLVLIDLTMPGMDGATSLAALRARRPEAQVAVVSGSLDRNDMVAAIASGVHGYVPKTLPIAEMTEALRRIVDGQVYLPPSVAEMPAAGAAHAPSAPAGRPAPLGGRATVGGVSLTPRQRTVLDLVRLGRTNREIAEAMELAPGTVKSHLASLFKAMGVRNRSEAAVAASSMLPS